MRELICALVVVGASLVATSAMAQAGGASVVGTREQSGQMVGRMNQGQQLSRFESEEMRRNADVRTPEELEAEYGAERMDLARRVADLIERGQCREARELASEAGERRMVIRIRQTCRQRR